MSGRLDGRIALVTGASEGIGRATALALAREGAAVVVTARNADALKQLVGEIESQGGKGLAVPGDARLDEDVARVRDATLALYDEVDILVNNVGIAKYAPFSEMTIEDYDWMMDTNMRSTFLFTKAFFPGMAERRQGWVVIVASVSGLMGLPNETGYAPSKHAQVGFARALDHEAIKVGVKVSLIVPGSVNTRHAFGTGRTPQDAKLPEYMDPQDVAEAVVFAVTQPEKSRLFMLGMRPMNETLFD
ncbi:MAG TPA: SDR family oxidoreductase [Anaerolineales bacterium]|nr:SDR family oxidoreductase [Anaerolineales bacterium]